MIREEFAKLVKQKREQLNLSQTELADRAGLSRPIVMHIEAQTQNISLEHAAKLAKVLSIDLSQFINNTLVDKTT